MEFSKCFALEQNQWYGTLLYSVLGVDLGYLSNLRHTKLLSYTYDVGKGLSDLFRTISLYELELAENCGL